MGAEGFARVRAHGNNLYMPLNRSEPKDAQLMIIDLWDKMVAMRDQIESLTGDYFARDGSCQFNVHFISPD